MGKPQPEYSMLGPKCLPVSRNWAAGKENPHHIQHNEPEPRKRMKKKMITVIAEGLGLGVVIRSLGV